MGFPDTSVGKESTCKADLCLIPVGKIHWRMDRLPTPVFLGFPCGSAGKESACNVRDLDSVTGLGRSPGEGKGSPLQFWPGEFQGLHRVRHDWVTFSFTFHSYIEGSQAARNKSPTNFFQPSRICASQVNITILLPSGKLLFFSPSFMCKYIYLYFKKFLSTLHGMWDPSSLTRDQTQAILH